MVREVVGSQSQQLVVSEDDSNLAAKPGMAKKLAVFSGQLLVETVRVVTTEPGMALKP